jgi:toxin ParE1/3/4
MRELLWTPEAIEDREAIYEHIETDNPAAALALDELFLEKTSRLLDHPELGKLGRVIATRELVLHQNYILVYTVITDAIWLLRVLHARRQWPSVAPGN